MSIADRDLYLDKPIHLNKFRFFKPNADENKHVFEHLEISLDGAIVAVKLNRVRALLEDPEIRKWRMGVEKMPRSFEVKTEDDFFKLLAVMVPVSEY